MAVTNHAPLARRMRLLRSHGITRDAEDMTQDPDGPWYYQQVDLGFNYRMTDLQAALGLTQLRRLDAFVVRRHRIAKRYDEALAHLPLVTPWTHPDDLSSWHLYVIRLKLDEIRKSHREVFEALRAACIGVSLHYIPVHRQPYYARMGFKPDACPEANRYYAEAISLPIYPGLTDREQDHVIRSVTEACTS
jgi:dTDP-4-amino-4,6-dideoxygalactose transaminase